MIDDFSKIERGPQPPESERDGNRKVDALVGQWILTEDQLPPECKHPDWIEVLGWDERRGFSISSYMFRSPREDEISWKVNGTFGYGVKPPKYWMALPDMPNRAIDGKFSIYDDIKDQK